MNPLHKPFWLTLLIALTGCGFWASEGKVEEKIQLLEKSFGVSWPTNCTRTYGATLSAAGRISDVVIRLEMADSTFIAWRQTATNNLREYQSFAPVHDPKLSERFVWWDCSTLPNSKVTAFIYDSIAGKASGGLLSAYAFETNGAVILYVHGSPAR